MGVQAESSAEKPLSEAVELVGPLEHDHVPAPGQHLEAGAGDPGGDPRGPPAAA